MPKEEPMIRVQDVKFRYDPEQPTYAVDGVSLNVRRGEFVAVLGANGCGKSTLAKHFNAILLPETGTVLVENMDTRGEDHLYDIRQKVGMVFQNPDNQIVATIVEEDVAFAPENLGVPPEEIRTRIDEAMKLAGIYEKREAAPYKLSGGQKQRVAIAGVIAMRPDCLVLDEATAMLDPHGGMAYGLDRIVMLMLGADSIRDVIAFPKVQNASEPMTQCPDFVDDKQLQELSIAVTEKEK